MVVACKLCKHVVDINGSFSWEWSEKSKLWKWEESEEFFATIATQEANVATGRNGPAGLRGPAARLPPAAPAFKKV